jgi:hypothetical protein
MPIYPTRQTESSRDEQQALPPGRLWRHLPAEQRQAAAECFWNDPEGAEQHAEALLWMAKQLKFRLKTLQHLPVEKKVQHLASLRGVPDTVAVRALVAYHLAHKREMMGAFLDLLGIAHDNGAITVEDLQPPKPEELSEAARKLQAQYPADDVQLYFATLLAQDPGTWGGLAEFVTPPADAQP